MARFSQFALVPLLGTLMATTALAQGAMTEVGTPRSETLIVQTFDGRTANPSDQNPLNTYAIWRGFRELGWSFLWEMDTATGEPYPELAAGMAEVLNDERTRFRVNLREGVYWSDGVEFTADDVIYTLETIFAHRGTLTNVATVANYVSSWEKIDDYTFEIETARPSYDFETVMGVYTWGSQFNIVPKHIFEDLGDDVVTFQNSPAVTLGPYQIADYDPNGFWQLWELREDWERSGWGNLGEPGPQYVFYKDFGPEETRALAFAQNQYDVDTFMSPDSIEAAQARNENIETFSPTFPFHDMNDACSYGIYINQLKAPYDTPEVRWALALAINLQQIGVNTMSGQFKAGALPLADTPITGPLYYDALEDFLNELTLSNGYQPFNTDFSSELSATLASQGVDDDLLPQGDALRDGFGMGWWNYDPEAAADLLDTVGITRGAEGFYTMPDGSPWELEFVFPGDWNTVMQRLGFAIADSWRQAGFDVRARQVDNGEFTTVQNTNARNELQLNWSNSCTYNSNWQNSWRQFAPHYLQDVASNDSLDGNFMRIADERIFDLVEESASLETDSEEFIENGREIARHLVEDMQMINIMNIPTTIPTNSTYWTNFPKQDNFYAAPYTWWSSFKQTIVNIEPTGN